MRRGGSVKQCRLARIGRIASMPKHSKKRPPRGTAGVPSASPPAAALSVGERRAEVRRLVAGAFLLVVLTVAVYAPVRSAGYIWDDDAYVTRNHLLETGSGLRDMWFRLGSTTIYAPAFFTTLWIEYQLWGLAPAGYHLVNVAFHLACALLLWRVLRRLGFGFGAAWLAAALFAVHPVMVESVAWVAELKNVQSAFFCLLSLLAYLRFDPLDGSEPPSPRERRLFYGLALLLFALALLSKPMAVTLPPAILVLIWWKRGRLSVRELVAIAPFLGLCLATGLLAIYIETHFGVATGAGFQLSLLERTLVAGRALWFYAAKLVWPTGLVSVYPRWQVGAQGWQFFFPLAALALVGVLWHWRSRIGRGPLAAVACFGILVAPLTGIFNVAYHMYSFVADHFQYYAAAAAFALFASGVASLRARSRPPVRRALDAACAALLLILAALAWRHVPSLHDEKTRCLTTIAGNPGAWSAMYNLGVQLKAEGNAQEALHWYGEALKVTPSNPEVLNNAGVALMSLGNVAEAVGYYREALRIWPAYALARNNLGTALASSGDREAAIHEYSEAVRIKPDYAEARANLAQLYAGSDRLDDAEREYREALRIRPGDADLHRGLGLTLARARRFEEAIASYRAALGLRPAHGPTHRDLASTLASSGDLAAAIVEYREALRLEPGDPTTHNGLAIAYATAGQPESAAGEFEAALALDPGYAEAHNNYGTFLASQGALDGAIAHFEQAIRLRPDYADARANLELARRQAGTLLR